MKNIDKIMEQMTLKDKVGQLFFCCHMPGDGLELTERFQPGGIVLFTEDFDGKTKQQAIQMIENLQQKSKIPMLIAVDEEGGTVKRVSRWPLLREAPFESPLDLVKSGGLDLVFSDTVEKSCFLKQFGINVNLAPVADVSADENSFIYPRTVGGDASFTSQYIEVSLKAMQQQNMGQAVKHFPGYSDNLDTHKQIAVDKRSLEQFEEVDLLPFKTAIKQNCSSILISHNIVQCIDDKMPASLSIAVHQYLRNNLSYDGVIMTDELYMQAIRDFCEGEDPGVLALLAGNDLIMTDHPELAFEPVMNAVQSGQYPMELLNRSVKRILEWKQQLNLM